MGWLLNTLGRAVVWQGVREAAYAARRTARQPRPPSIRRLPAPQGGNRVVISYICIHGHHHVVETTDRVVNLDTESVLGRERCPECGAVCKWQTMDQHIINRG